MTGKEGTNNSVTKEKTIVFLFCFLFFFKWWAIRESDDRRRKKKDENHVKIMKRGTCRKGGVGKKKENNARETEIDF